MKAFLDDRQARHAPQTFIAAGQRRPSPEQPERIARLRAGAEAAGCVITAPPDAGLDPIAAVQDARYLRFLQTIHARWSQIEGASDEVIPNVHARARSDGYPSSPVGQAGFHQADTACPISEHAWEAAYWSAQSAIAGADEIAGGARRAYALCRPPGHHAYADQAGGFCFLNNSGIAAQRLLEAGHRPAILDVDVHHGNGTQGMFYGRGDVLTVSVHADPSGFYPFFWGYEYETGEGAGAGTNLNLPLPMGSGNSAFMQALEVAFARIEDFGADVIVVALGLDAHESDPFQALRVTTDGFREIAMAIAGLNRPCLCVQEGGYLSEALAHNLTAFLEGIEG